MKFLIIGGDKRNIKLAELLKNDNNEVKTFALNSEELNNLEQYKEETFDVIIGPIPFLKEETLNAPFAKQKVLIGQLLPILSNQTLIAGPFEEHTIEKAKMYNINLIDIMEIEEFAIYNTIATAEGTIEIAISNTEKNLHESKILILGYGRVAKTLAIKLKGLADKITCAARKEIDFSWMEALKIEKENINYLGKNLNKYDIIINTVPQIILKEEQIKNIREDTLIIDLASEPGGVDRNTLKGRNLKYILASGIPRKNCSTFICKIYKTNDLQYNEL